MYSLLLDGAKITTKQELYAAIGEQLPLPGWFGKNLDALYDTLTCDIMPKDSVCVKIVSADALRENLGPYADVLIGMLGDIADEDKRLTLEITE